MLEIFLFILGLALLLLGSTGVVKNAIIISRLAKISPLIIGVTIVAIGTSLPEITVSFFGGVEKATDLSLGNIIGSNIANIGLILGVSLLIKRIYIGKNKTQKNMLATLFISIILFATLLIDGLTIMHGLIFVILGFGFIGWLVKKGRKEELPEELLSKHADNPILAVGVFIISLIALIIGGKLLVDAGVSLAHLLKISEEIIGITALAIGTSLPELAVSIIGLTRSSSYNEEKLVVGNILGSNIFNIVFGAGTLGLFGIKHFNDYLSLYVFLIFTVFLCLLIYYFKGKTIPRYFGGILVTLYIIYLVVIIKPHFI